MTCDRLNGKVEKIISLHVILEYFQEKKEDEKLVIGFVWVRNLTRAHLAESHSSRQKYLYYL